MSADPLPVEMEPCPWGSPFSEGLCPRCGAYVRVKQLRVFQCSKCGTRLKAVKGEPRPVLQMSDFLKPEERT